MRWSTSQVFASPWMTLATNLCFPALVQTLAELHAWMTQAAQLPAIWPTPSIACFTRATLQSQPPQRLKEQCAGGARLCHAESNSHGTQDFIQNMPRESIVLLSDSFHITTTQSSPVPGFLLSFGSCQTRMWQASL